MTIVTKPLSGAKENKEKEALETLINVEGVNGVGVDQPDLLQEGRQVRLDRLRRGINILGVSLCLGLLGMTGLIAGSFLYKRTFLQRYYCGSYKIPLPLRKIQEHTFVSGKINDFSVEYYDILDDDQNLFALLNQDKALEEMMKDFEFDVELDLDDEAMESVELPEVFSGRYLHDFKANRTVIIDPLGARRFIMKLDRNVIPKPKNLFDYLTKEREGVYNMNYEEVKQTYRITGEPIQLFDTNYGKFIPDACSDKITYELEELVDRILYKREAPKLTKYGEFVGNKLIKYHIVNLSQA